MIAFFAIFVGHVPKYDGCDHNCCHFPHDVTTSQVAYLKGSGGIEYDIHALEGEEHVDYNLVFKKPYDTSTFSVYAGCGGCASKRPFHWDEPQSLPLATRDHYYSPKLEAFTQHSYYEVLPRPVDADGEDHSPQFDLSTLANCSSHHFSVRLIVHDNATEDIIYGVVVGCEGLDCERFTVMELLSFPIYVIRNHGPAWNRALWTIFLIALTVPLLMAFILWWWWGGMLALYVPVGVSFPRQLSIMNQSLPRHWANLKGVCWVPSPRCFWYAVAVYAITVDLLETFAHFLIAARDVPAGEMGYTMFMWWYAVKIVFLLAVALPWMWAREVPEHKWRWGQWECRCCDWFGGIGPFSPFWAHGAWCLLDLPLAVAALFVGAGFYLYPLAAFIAAAIRFFEWVRGERVPPKPCDELVVGELGTRRVWFKMPDEETESPLLPALGGVKL
tara:strand:- start:4094 stop:5425 length:1332 start_codon:yes stop_codon:yes gene_type:complete